jgi:hypothetical protein
MALEELQHAFQSAVEAAHFDSLVSFPFFLFFGGRLFDWT